MNTGTKERRRKGEESIGGMLLRCIFPLLVIGLSTINGWGAAKRAEAGKTDVATQLRADWKMADLKLQKEAIDDASFAADVKQKAMSAVDWFLQQQEGLISQAQKSAKGETAARKSRPQIEAEFRKRMAVIYDDPKLMTELGRRMKALNKEMDTIAASADRMFAELDGVGLTAAQKKKLKPIVDQASDDLKRTAAKAPSKTHKDPAVKDEAVSKYSDAKRKIRGELTTAQKVKLAKKMEE